MDKLLMQVSEIHKRYALIYEKTGTRFNIFNITGISSKELFTCKLLYELLNPKGVHSQGIAYLKLFMEKVLKIESEFSEHDYKTARVLKEYSFGKRRVDLYIEIANIKIPIEVKIFAGDQYKQLYDYHKLLNTKVYYLTRDGEPPSEWGAEGLDKDDDGGYCGVHLISFKDDITCWLDSCLALPQTVRIAPIREILVQFRESINKLTGQMEEEPKMEVVSTIMSSTENMQSAIDIERALPEAKTKVLLNFMNALKEAFVNDGYDKDAIELGDFKEYYLNKRSIEDAYLGIRILDLNDKLNLHFGIAIDWYLYYYFAFERVSKRKTYSYPERKAIMKKHPDIYEKVEKSIWGDENIDNSKQADLSIKWDFILDESSNKYDFKNFSDNCVALTESYSVVAQQIAGKLIMMINEVKEVLNE